MDGRRGGSYRHSLCITTRPVGGELASWAMNSVEKCGDLAVDTYPSADT